MQRTSTGDSFWDTETTPQVVYKNPTNQYRISFVTKDGRAYLNIREWYQPRNADGDEWYPGKAGAAIPAQLVGLVLDSISQVFALQFESEAELRSFFESGKPLPAALRPKPATAGKQPQGKGTSRPAAQS